MTVPLPPKISELKAHTRLIAGLSHSTILPDFDFETFSPAGYTWNIHKGSYDAPHGSNVKGLPAVGVAVYTEHPDAEVLSCAYNLKDGKGARLWTPDLPAPVDLFDHLANGGLLEAWNSFFEYSVWNNICVKKYGWPFLPIGQLRCAMAKARAFGLPGSLAYAGDVIKSSVTKDKDGKRLLNKFSMPRKPTKADPSHRIRPQDDPDDAKRLYEYNLRDIEAEAEIAAKVPDLNDFEQAFWLLDQRINARGVRVDTKAIQDCIAVIEQAYTEYNGELRALTKGAVESASQVARLITWLASLGIHTTSLDDEHITTLLQRDDLTPDVRRVLTIRSFIGSAAVKKLYAMINRASKEGRLHELFVYHSARTGRFAGAGVQPQNFPNSGNPVRICDCHRYNGVSFKTCAWCGQALSGTPKDWNPQAVEDALYTIASRDLKCVEYFWGDAISIISGCLRGMFIASPGHDLICSDYSAIEAVVLAALAGEEWQLDVFRTHGKIYEMTGARIARVPFEDIDKSHPARKLGKIASLACFSPDTQVLTDKGYVRIKDVKLSHKLWDGEKWVTHEGVIYKKIRKIIKLDGIGVTPNHPISLGHFWTAAKQLNLNKNMLGRALEIGSENLPSLNVSLPIKLKFLVLAALHHILSNLVTCMVKNPLVVIFAQRKNRIKHILNYMQNTRIFWKIPNIGVVLLIDFVQRLLDAIHLRINTTPGMAVVGLPFFKIGETTPGNFLNTSLPWKGGISRLWKWTESTLIKVMNPVISVSYLVKRMHLIKEKLMIWKKKSKNWSPVYDIVNAGNLHRFTIKTNSGHLIVHNSGYQGWLGAWKQFGADSFLSDDEIKQSILAWRAASPAIVRMWGDQPNWRNSEYIGLEGMAVQAIMNPGVEFNYRGITYLVKRNIMYCRLLSGRYIAYHNPRLSLDKERDKYRIEFDGYNTNPMQGAIGWVSMQTYGGKLTENVVQATARDLLAYAMINLEAAGYPIVLHVHDEIVAEVPEGVGSVSEFERIMATPPAWAANWPIKASGGWRAKRYGK